LERSPSVAPLGRLCLAAPELAHVLVAAEPPAGRQLTVLGRFDDPPVIDDQNLVGVADHAQAMGDDEAGPAGEQLLKRCRDQALGACVNAGGGLGEDEEAWVGRGASCGV